MSEDVRAIIAGVAAAAGEGADALRKAGIGVELRDFRVEVQLEPGEPPSMALTLSLGERDTRHARRDPQT
jgi:hypothetical protein